MDASYPPVNSYAFFINKWIEENDSCDQQIKNSATSDSDIAEISNNILQMETSSTMFRPPLYIPFSERCLQMKENLFMSYGKEKTDDVYQNNILRLEEEGFYVDESRLKFQRNLHVLQNRLSRDGKSFSRWIKENGKILRNNIPVTQPVTQIASDIEDPVSLLVPVPALPQDQFLKLNVCANSSPKGMLRIEVASLQLDHHQLFSEEHVLSSQLTADYNCYRKRKNLNLTNIQLKKLKVLRKSLLKLDTLSRASSSTVLQELNVSRRKTLYFSELKECRKSVEIEAECDRQLINSILKLWYEIKELRKFNGFQTTNVHLKILQLPNKSFEEEERKWKKDFTIEVEERLHERKEEYREKVKNYKIDISKWKEEHKKRKEAQNRVLKIDSADSDDFSEQDLLQIAHDQVLLSTPEAEKPEMPEEPSENEVKEEVKILFKKTRRPPNEPEIDFELLNSGSISDSNICPSKERHRRNIVSKTNIFLKIFINKKLVIESTPVKLNNDFSVSINRAMFVALYSWPKDILIDYFQKTSLNVTSHLASSFLPIPPPTAVENDSSPFQEAPLTSSKVFKAPTGGVGCGLSDADFGASFIRGSLSFRVSWKKGSEGQALVPPGGSFDKLKTVINECDGGHLTFDPNDPRNARLLQQVKLQEETFRGKMFQIDGLQTFCSEDEFENNVRLKALRLRSEGISEFKSLKMVPARESFFIKKTLERYEEKNILEMTSATDNSAMDLWPENRKKCQAEKLVQSLLKKHELKWQVKSTQELQDVVQEEQIPNIGTIGELLTILKPYRPLHPERKKRGQIRGIAIAEKNVNLIVHIARGFKVPVRQEASSFDSPNARKGSISDDLSNVVRPFIEVSFQRSVARTASSFGPNPTWNEQLVLPFRAPNDDFSPSSLQLIEDCIYFHLYDEVFHSLLNDHPQRDTIIHHQIERRWLGSLKIPFSTLYLNNKIEGTFCLESPSVLLGYSAAYSISTVHTKKRGNGELDSNFSSPHLSIYLTLEPTLPPPEILKSGFECSEPCEVFQFSKEWVSALKNKFPARHYASHVLDFSGKLVFISRFISPLQPPSSIVGDGTRKKDIYLKLAWYVSLMPTLASLKRFPNSLRPWANSEQFLNFGIGHDEERALTLASFYLALGLQAYLLIGNGIPEGLSSYILFQEEDDDWVVVCPSTAAFFSVHQTISPLKSVYMLVSEDNIYANIQKYDDPPRVNFDVRSTSNWKPFFSRSLPNPGLASLQPSIIDLQPPDLEYWSDLQEKLHVILRDALMKWRPSLRTPWNGHASSVLLRILKSFEKAKMKKKALSAENDKLLSLMSCYKMCGVCLQQPYKTTASLVEALYSTGIHAIGIPGAEFALALNVVPYEGDVASVWVYIASLVRRETV